MQQIQLQPESESQQQEQIQQVEEPQIEQQGRQVQHLQVEEEQQEQAGQHDLSGQQEQAEQQEQAIQQAQEADVSQQQQQPETSGRQKRRILSMEHVPVFSCDLCLFETDAKLNLKNHYQFNHNIEADEVQLRPVLSKFDIDLIDFINFTIKSQITTM